VVIVRPATAQDVPALRSLGVRTWRDTFEGVLPDAVVEGGIAEFFNEYSLGAAVREGRMLAAVRDGVLVGLLEFDRVDARRAMVWKVYVAPEAQGRGIGGRLLERLLQTAGTAEVRAEHDERNAAAAALFDAFGFAVDDVAQTGGGARTVRRVRRLSALRAPPGSPAGTR
jgi:ribosomal protein S18 acetylase RimI-like enzyme